MKILKLVTVLFVAVASVWLFGGSSATAEKTMEPGSIKLYSVERGAYFYDQQLVRSEEEWKQLLTDKQYHILREEGTERAFTGKYWNHKGHGVYKCAGCELDLYHSDTKFKSGTGWPSFFQPVAPENVSIREDRSFFMIRNELICSRCGGHLGHVFDDGPAPTGMRHCINSESLLFQPLAQ
jgi:peptide-methionine (R)-S-oxide reductase